jgi:hypothetical protein
VGVKEILMGKGPSIPMEMDKNAITIMGQLGREAMEGQAIAMGALLDRVGSMEVTQEVVALPLQRLANKRLLKNTIHLNRRFTCIHGSLWGWYQSL